MAHALFDEDYLRKLEALRLILTRRAGGAPGGGRVFGDRGGAIEFSGHRAYAPGDDLRGLDWAVWARLEKLVMKEFHREEAARVHVLVDRSASMGFGSPSKFDTARRLAAALAYVALAGEDQVFAGLFGPPGAFEMRPGAVGTGAVHGILDFLAAAEPRGRTAFDALARDFLTPSRTRGPVIVISDFWEEGDPAAAALRRMAERGFDVAAVHLLAPEESAPPSAGLLALADSESGETLSIMIGEGEQRAYADAFAKHCEALAAQCARNGVRFARARSDMSLEDLLFQVLQKALVIK